jgi:lysine 6-dehydrogenase
MKVVVLGGLGLQGRAALADLACNGRVERIVCADANLGARGSVERFSGSEKISFVRVDAASRESLVSLFRQGVHAVVDLLPFPLMCNAFEAALEAGVPMVSTNYGHTVRHLHGRALEAEATLMPECGLDPGIDLIICGHAVRQFDAVHVLNSYCGGFPERRACDNPLNYKISWNWDMVLRAQMRDSVFIRDGRRVNLSAEDQHRPDMARTVFFPGLGDLEGVPNGDAAFYAELLGIGGTLREAGRYALRWPGWCAFWHTLKQLGFLSEEPVEGLGASVTPREFLVKHLGPRLQYGKDEKDLAAMVNHLEGIKDGRAKRIVVTLLMERDLTTGLLAMSTGVASAACIVAEMIVRGEVTRRGILNPATDVPYESFMKELSKRGIRVQEEVTEQGQ